MQLHADNTRFCDAIRAATSTTTCESSCYTCSRAHKYAPPKSRLGMHTDGASPELKSSCTEGMTLEGVTWLKGQTSVQALPDEEYPEWLWTILEPKVLEDDGPGGKAEKVRLRKINRQRIREQNFMKTQ